MIKYFTYGSNMDKNDLDKWCSERGYPNIKSISVKPVKLCGYRLSFNYYSSSRNAGAANIMEDIDSCLYGLLIEMEDKAKGIIRKKEGFPNYYCEHFVDVETFNREIFKNVLTYKVVKEKERSEDIKPTKYYLDLIINNAKKYNFPKNYIDYLSKLLKT